MEKPTCEQLFDREGYYQVERKVDDGWRHGVYVTEVYLREWDRSYWMATYRLSTDGETNELREGLADIQQVSPREITTTSWVVVLPIRTEP